MSPPLSRTDTIRFLTLDEFGRLLAAARGSSRDRALFLLAYRHGLRASEVGLLRAEDLNLRTLRLTVHRLKGSHSGTHPLQPDEAKAIRAWLREREQPPSPVLFPSNRGDPDVVQKVPFPGNAGNR
jgi:type 1 fimbriae regulatory protein FimB